MRANHALLLLVLVLVGVWVALYTNHFPLVGNLLGLSGVLAVIPAFVGLLPEAQRKAYMTLVNRMLFRSRNASRLYVLALAGVFALFLFAKPLEIEYLEAGPTRRIEIAFSDERVRVLRLSPFTEARLPVWSVLSDTPRVTVSSPGLPTRILEVSYFDKELAVPDDLWQRPVILVLPAVEDLADIVKRKMLLEVEVSGTENEVVTFPEYAGWAIWLGTDRSLEIPSSLRNQLETMERNVILAMAGRNAEERLRLASIVFNWSRPALSGIAQLSPADVVTIRLRARGDHQTVISETEIVVDSASRYPLIRELHHD